MSVRGIENHRFSKIRKPHKSMIHDFSQFKIYPLNIKNLVKNSKNKKFIHLKCKKK